jgi:hypothetical protein
MHFSVLLIAASKFLPTTSHANMAEDPQKQLQALTDEYQGFQAGKSASANENGMVWRRNKHC